jgi:proteasome lid subunit RPN8/RPN11
VRLPDDILEATYRTLRDCGRGECECVVYWTGPARQDVVDGFEHPPHRRSPGGYEVDSAWLTEFWKDLAAGKRSVKAQIHTHPGEAFHSSTDDTWPIVSQAGFLSVVIPDFAAGEPTLEAAWIGRLQPDGEWRQVESAADVFDE